MALEPGWERATHHDCPSAAPAWITVVIPTLNEEQSLPNTLAMVAGRDDVEVIVVDGGSTDSTCAVATRFGAKLLRSAAGRGRQMNVGAEAARGEALLFLHADTQLPADFTTHVRRALSRPGVVGGAFRLRIDAAGPALRLVEWGANARAKFFRMPYGDQALFASRAMFQRIGGFPDLPIMEDLVFVRRLRRFGRLAILRQAVQTSARRWARLGALKATLLNQLLLVAFFVGWPPNRLAGWYR